MTPFAQTLVRTTTIPHHTECGPATTAHNARLRRTVIRAGTLVNSGRVAGVEGLDIATTHALLNTGGALASESDIAIDAGALFANLSGTVSGGYSSSSTVSPESQRPGSK